MASLPGEKGAQAVAIAVVSVVGLIGLGLGYRAYQKNKAERDSRREGKDLDKTIEGDIKGSGKPTTLIPTNYKLFADRLYKTLNVWGPNVAQVYQVFAQMNNDRDILELIKAFGMRLDSSNGIDDDIDANLGTFIQKLNDDEITALNMMLAKKAIRYRF